MLYRPYTETKVVASSITWGTSKQTVSMKIATARRRLEGIMLEFVYLTAAAAPTVTSDGFANIASEIRLRINDVIGSRNVVQCPSSQLISFVEDSGGFPSRHNLFGERPVTAAKNYRVQVFVPIRHPSFSEPVGNILGIPLDQLNEDPTLEIDIAPNSDCASANPSVSIPIIRATMMYRDVDPAVKYLPTELVSNKYVLPATGKQSYELSNGGFLSSWMIDQYSTFSTARSLLYTATDHEFQIDLGSVAQRRYFPTHMDALADYVSGALPSATPFFSKIAAVDTSATDVSFSGRGLGHYHFDFLFDDTAGGAVSPASMLNANTIPLGGDKVKFTGTNFGTAGTILFTHHKFLTRSVEDLKALVGL